MRAALKLFAVKEFGRITLRDIQEASGFDAALIYYYFKDKQDLFDAAVKFALSEALDDKQYLREYERDPVEAIRSWFAHCLKMAEENRTIFRIMFHHGGSPKVARRLDRSVQDFYQHEETDILARSIKRGIATGLFRNVDAANVARFVSVHLDGITAASIVRRNFDVTAALRDLEEALWLQLGYGPGESKSARSGARPANQSAMRPTKVSIGR